MKKLLLFFILLIFLLGACSMNNNDSENDIQDDPEETEENQTDTETDEDTDDPVEENNEQDAEENQDEVVLENEAFRIFEPAPESIVGNEFTVRGEARVFEGTVMYEFEDGHNILDEGFVTASEGAPGWGEFEIIISFDEVANNNGMVILYEESAKDGSRTNELIIPVIVE